MMNRLSAMIRKGWNGGMVTAPGGNNGHGGAMGERREEPRSVEAHALVHRPLEPANVRPTVVTREDCLAADPVVAWPAEACRVVRELRTEMAELAEANDRLRLALRVRDQPVQRDCDASSPDHPPGSADAGQDARQPQAVLESALVARCELLRQFDQRLLPPLREIRHALNMLNVLNRTNPSGQGYLHMGIGACHQLERGLRDILELRSACLDCIALRRDLFNMETVLDNLQATFAPSCHARSIELRAKISPCVPDQMAGDPERVEQILFHLVDNAVRNTRQGQVRVEVETLTSADPQRLRLSLAVHDTGCGIPEPLLERLSASMLDGCGDSGGHAVGRGLGVGLVMVKKLVGLMDGQFRLESLEGAYTSAYCSIALERLPGEEAC